MCVNAWVDLVIALLRLVNNGEHNSIHKFPPVKANMVGNKNTFAVKRLRCLKPLALISHRHKAWRWWQLAYPRLLAGTVLSMWRMLYRGGSRGCTANYTYRENPWDAPKNVQIHTGQLSAHICHWRRVTSGEPFILRSIKITAKSQLPLPTPQPPRKLFFRNQRV